MTHLRPVVLCGGAGARLWPLSRPDRPKPLLALTGERSLLEETLGRFSTDPAPWLVCGASHARAFALAAPGCRRIIEPVGRGTAPAALVAARLALEEDRDAVVVLAPADHAIAPVEAFRSSLGHALRAAEDGWIVTFGVQPRGPATGFGWITPGEALGSEGARVIARFVEKPDAATARALLDAGCAWNSGMFVARADRLVEEGRALIPEVLAAVDRALHGATRGQAEVRLATSFATCPETSFDVGILQRTRRAAVVPASFRWADLGTWGAVAEARGGRRGVHVISDGPAVEVVGDLDVLVAVTGGAVLVAALGDEAPIAVVPRGGPAILDRGPGWTLERRAVEAGTTWSGPGTAVVLAGRAGEAGPGAVLTPGTVATEPSTWLVATFSPGAG